ncbi:hypothetical protein SteCoe_16384 [Stentor coeruleus]|uniref:RRM domain-containing protein n=1 Tax=Stentor coeruleus TaxID=5963 RepID=A0A1R2C1J0_9CILI|nr:hypothetical protein SteCoe_16384 [Stentor coeruleus]
MKKLGKHGGRLIIRNLPFSIEENFLRKTLEKIGTLKEFHVPLDLDKKRNKGFAFVEYEKKNLSEKAIKALNGMKIQKREISVDYALSKDKYLTTKKSEEMAKDFKHQDNDEDMEIVDEAKEDDEQEEVEEEDNEEIKKKELKFEDGTTLFIMNLNYETGEDDLFEFFKDFGKIKYVKVCVNKETGESRGSGFVCFKKAEDADKVVKIADEQGVELQERSLKIMKAVSKETAVNLKSAKPPKNDGRNLYLSKLSLIQVGSEMFKTLTPKEIEMRTSAAKKMIEKLQNPNIFVSPTRLLFKNISKVISDDDLKILVKKILFDSNPELQSQKLFKQVKILKEPEKLDKKGNPMSKGIAFIEFKKHEYALLAQEKCNNDSKYFGQKHRPIVEFALEDHRILRIRKLKLKRQKQAQEKMNDGKSSKKKLGRGKRQRLKRQKAVENKESL